MSAEPMAALEHGRQLLDRGEPAQAIALVAPLITHSNPDVAGAAAMLSGTARYRLDDEAGALADWRRAAETDGSASWLGWRSVAEQLVRLGDLDGAIDAYREADQRAPAEERPPIASRIAWLLKETGHDFAARREFNRSRGPYATYRPVVTYGLIAINVGVFLVNLLIAGQVNLFGSGGPLLEAGAVYAPAVAAGEWYRIFTSAFLHVNLMHLVFNMWALYLFGPVVEQLYGHLEYLAIYLLAAVGGSVLTILVTPEQAAVGASGAIFGLLGLAFAVSRRRHLALPRQTRVLLGQAGGLLVLNLIITFAVPGISWTGHLGGMLVGIVLGFLLPPSPSFTLAGRWQAPAGQAPVASAAPALRVGIYLLVAAGLAVGTYVAVLNVG